MDTDFELTFNTRKQHHLLSLTQSYEALVEAAYDKEYASRAYAESLFEPILAWKSVSLYFERVLGLVVHYSKIDPSNMMRLTIANIAELKSNIFDALPIFDETDPTALSERYFLQLSDIELIDHIAKFSAALDLSKSLAPKEPEIIEASVVEKKKIHHFTRNQQLLALYYTLKSIGIEPRKTTDMTNYARFVHLLAGVDFNKVENGIFYTKIQKLPNILTDAYLKKDLEFIRTYFLSIEAHSIVEQIDLEIKGCSDNF